MGPGTVRTGAPYHSRCVPVRLKLGTLLGCIRRGRAWSGRGRRECVRNLPDQNDVPRARATYASRRRKAGARRFREGLRERTARRGVRLRHSVRTRLRFALSDLPTRGLPRAFVPRIERGAQARPRLPISFDRARWQGTRRPSIQASWSDAFRTAAPARARCWVTRRRMPRPDTDGDRKRARPRRYVEPRRSRAPRRRMGKTVTPCRLDAHPRASGRAALRSKEGRARGRSWAIRSPTPSANSVGPAPGAGGRRRRGLARPRGRGFR